MLSVIDLFAAVLTLLEIPAAINLAVPLSFSLAGIDIDYAWPMIMLPIALAISVACLVIGLTFGVLTATSGSFIYLSVNLKVVKSMAIMNILNFPFGTLLGGVTLNFLSKPEYRLPFEHEPRKSLGPVLFR